MSITELVEEYGKACVEADDIFHDMNRTMDEYRDACRERDLLRDTIIAWLDEDEGEDGVLV